MKKLKTIIFLIFVLAVIAVGIYTPKFVSAVYDYHLSTQIKQMDNSNISLNFSKKANYFERAYYFNDAINYGNTTYLEPTLKYNMSAQDVEKSVNKVIDYFGLNDLLSHSPKIIPVLSVYYSNMQMQSDESVSKAENNGIIYDTEGNNLSVSNIYWQCIWNSDDFGEQIIYIDDQTGLVVGFSVDISLFFDGKSIDFNDTDNIVSNYLKDECSADKIELKYDYDSGTGYIIIINDDKKFSYPVYIDGGRLFFNLT